jgi:hypothetical protein
MKGGDELKDYVDQCCARPPSIAIVPPANCDASPRRHALDQLDRNKHF